MGLQWTDVDLQRGKPHVRRTIWRGVTGLPKGGRERTVELPGSAVDALRAHRHLRGPYVFCQEDGRPLTNGTMKSPLERALREADICREQGRIGWHDLRHTYGSHLAMRGVPPGQKHRRGTLRAHAKTRAKKKPSNPSGLLSFAVWRRRESKPPPWYARATLV